MKLRVKHIYLILAGAMFLDLILMPWFFGMGWLFKFTLIVLPFLFLFLEDRRVLTYLFILLLIYFRVTGFFNLGLLFLALGSFLIYERWFLINFFHKTAWQTLVFSGGGIAVFYAVLLGLSSVFSPEALVFNQGIALSILLSAIAAAIFNVMAAKFILKS
ncbi:MAG: hypothetical protein AAB911_01760 [Patescibacteria group bacterium]